MIVAIEFLIIGFCLGLMSGMALVRRWIKQ